MSSSTRNFEKEAEKDQETGSDVPPIGGKVPLATPDAQHQGEGWVQVGPTNINKDPDAILDNKKKKN